MLNYPSGSSSDLLNIKQTAKYLGVCTKTVRKLIKAKELRAHKVGEQWPIMPADVRGYLASVRR